MNTRNLNNKQEDVLYQRLVEGDEMAFREVHQLYKARLLFYGKRFLEDWSEAEDVVAESFLALWNHRHRILSDAHIKNFLFMAVRNKAINSSASRKRHERLLEDMGNAEAYSADSYGAEYVKEEMMYLLDQAVLSLPKESRRIFELSWDKELSPREIARILDMNPATVRSQKRRAIQLIQDWIKKNVPALFWLVCQLLTVHRS